MEIRTRRLLLRPYRLTDLEAALAFQSDAEALRYEPWGPHTREEVANSLKLLVAYQGAARQEWMLELAIARLADGQVVGGCRLQLPVMDQHGWATLGYVIGREYWGEGYATEAATALIEFAESKHNIVGVKAISDGENAASLRVLEKCGMTCVGMIAETERVKGRFRDMMRYELRF